MSSFTMPLKRVIELTGGVVTYENMHFNQVQYGRIARLTGGNIGIEGYPIFDEDYRNILAGKIIDKYWNREIGVETIDMFQMSMRTRLNEIMPLYNQLYLSTLIDYNPLSTFDITTKGTTDSTEDSESNTIVDSNNVTGSESRAVNSTTPQTMLSGDEDYATSAADANSENTTFSDTEQDSTATNKTNTETESNTSGYQAVPASLIIRHREAMLNIDQMVLSDVEECFMLVWDHGDTYTARGY